MGEKQFVNFEESFFVVDKQIKEVAPVLLSKVSKFNSVFGQRGKFQKTLFEFSCFIGVFVKLLEFFLVVDFIFKSAFHNVFSDFFNAFNKQTFKLVFISNFNDLFKVELLELHFFFVKVFAQLFNGICIICLKCFYVQYDFFFDLFYFHFGVEDQLNKLFKLQVCSHDVSVARGGTVCLWSSSNHRVEVQGV